ncbi:MAG: glycerol kinase GlpK, partial [Candidatus Riflebacteria bacterium]|nr:glycerol kinase GlpK [Candidatus Riflebacteria bacterium]
MVHSSSARHVMAIDSGTTSTTVLILSPEGDLVGRGSAEIPQIYPRPGWVEHDPEAIWKAAVEAIHQALSSAGISAGHVGPVGVTNQRETTIVWDRSTGRPVMNAIVWQCRRTSEICASLKRRGLEGTFRRKTGLVLDPYFSGTKLKWILDADPELTRRARKGDLLFGTVDTWLLWRLTGGASHATDVTNASRTLMFNIHTRDWDDELLQILGVPREMLPRVQPSASRFGTVADFTVLPSNAEVLGMAGDQQAALYGQGCFGPGEAKNTYGTGCFLLMNTGSKAVQSTAGLLTTLAADSRGQPVFALEGAVFIAGAAVQWLRDGLSLIARAAETDAVAASVPSTEGVFFVPAFTGLGAPHWDPEARGAIVGLTRGTTRAHLVRATLEAMAFQTHDVLECMGRESGIALKELKVDGGASANNFLMQFQADLSGVPVDRPLNVESTALGAAFLAGVGAEIWSPEELLKIRCTERR